MPKSGAQRTQKYRQKMDEQKKSEEKEKNKTQQRKSRINWTDERKKIEAAISKERMQKYRLKKKAVLSSTDQDTPRKAYTTPQSLAKAVNRVKKTLPLSPRKKKAVITVISRQIKLPDLAPSTHSAENVQVDYTKVTEFYASDLVSRIMPGKRDCVTVKSNSGKQKYQKRILIMSVMEAFHLFKRENSDFKIGKSKFAALRPPFVLPISEKDHTVCCCKYHENFDLLVQGMKKFHPDLPSSSDNIMLCAVCRWEYNCCFGKCEHCCNIEDYVNALFMDVQENEDVVGQYWQWEHTNRKICVTSTLCEMKESFLAQLQYLLKHTFTAKIQLRQIKFLKSSLKEGEAILHVDFAENFAIKHQNEIMSAHWVSDGVTIYTAVINDCKKATSYVVVSDDMTHDKCAVNYYNRVILTAYSKECPLSTLHVFSDGAGSQFKNRYTMSLLLEPQKICPNLKSVDWSFFGTAHGKGPVDGVGGTVKRAVWRRILQQKVVVNTAKDFADVATESCPNIKVIFVPATEICAVRQTMLEFWKEKQPNPIPNTHSIHYAVPKNDTSLLVSALSPYIEEVRVNLNEVVMYDAIIEPEYENAVESSSSSAIASLSSHLTVQTALGMTTQTEASASSEQVFFNEGDFVVVEYDRKRYPGIIQKIDTENQGFMVDVMHACIGGWKWPQPRDQIWYSKEKVIEKVEHPSPINDRGVFHFNGPI